jgi:hypothetical protein
MAGSRPTSPQLVLPSGRQSLFVLSGMSFPYSNWVSRAGASAAGFPRPEGADISQQNSAFAAARQGRHIPREHQSLVTVRTVLTPEQPAYFLEARALRRRNAPPRTDITLSSDSRHASHAKNSGGSTKCEIAVSISSLVYAAGGGGGGRAPPPPHTHT